MNQENNISKTISSGAIFLIGIPFATGIAIAILSPLDVLKYSLPHAVAEISSFIFPAVRKMEGNSELWQVAKLYFATMWLMSPLIFIGAYKDLQRQAEKIIKKCKNNKLGTAFFSVILFPASAIALTTINFESNDFDNARAFLTFHSRWGMPIWGFVIPTGACAGFAFTAFWVRNFFRIFS